MPPYIYGSVDGASGMPRPTYTVTWAARQGCRALHLRLRGRRVRDAAPYVYGYMGGASGMPRPTYTVPWAARQGCRALQLRLHGRRVRDAAPYVYGYTGGASGMPRPTCTIPCDCMTKSPGWGILSCLTPNGVVGWVVCVGCACAYGNISKM